MFSICRISRPHNKKPSGAAELLLIPTTLRFRRALMFAETASSHCNRTSRDSEMTFRDPVPRNRLEQSGEASQEIQRIVGTARDRSSFSREPYRIGCARG